MTVPLSPKLLIMAVTTQRELLEWQQYSRSPGLRPHRRRAICCYVLYNFKDTPDDLYKLVRDLLSGGAPPILYGFSPFTGPKPLRRTPIFSPDPTPEKPNMVANGRRVIGYGGAFPPYRALVRKCKGAKAFDEAFALRVHEDEAPSTASRRKSRQPREGFELREFAWDLIQMGKDQQFTGSSPG